MRLTSTVLVNSIAVCFIVGILLGDQLRDWKLAGILFVCALIVHLIVMRRFAKRSLISIGILFLTAGMLVLGIRAPQEQNPLDAWMGQEVLISGVSTQEALPIALDEKEKQTTYLIDVFRLAKGEWQAEVSAKVLVTVYDDKSIPTARIGDLMNVQGTLKEIHDFGNPGRIDRVRSFANRGIYGRMNAKESDVWVVRTEGDYQRTIGQMRDAVKARLQDVMPPSDAAMLFAMMFGGYSGISPEWIEDFSVLGIIHILSVSGAHVAVIAGFIMMLCRLLRVRGIWQFALLMLTIVCYALMAGLTPPIVRASVMGIVSFGAVAFHRERGARNALALVAVGMLVQQPMLVYDVSYQLSFVATAGILYLAPKIEQVLHRLPRSIASGIAITMAAQLSTLVFIAEYFHRISPSSLIANLLIVPILEVAMMLCLVGVLVSLIWTWGGAMCLIAGSFGLGLAMEEVRLFTLMPFASVDVSAISVGGIVLYYAILLWLFGYHPRIVPSVRCIWEKRTWRRCGVLGIVLVLAGAVYVYMPTEEKLRVHYLDVGQGNCALIETPHKQYILIDAGGKIGRGESAYDIGARVVVPYLRYVGVDKLDRMLLTHGHQDHAGGAAAIVKAIPADTIMVAREHQSSSIRALLRQEGQYRSVHYAESGHSETIDGVEITILQAPTELQGAKAGNEASNIVRVSYAGKRFLFTGDMESLQEESILMQNLDVKSDVLCVAHHGSKTSTSAAFLARCKPTYGIVSAGYRNMFSHPHQVVLERLAAENVEVWRTDRQGLALLEATADGVCIVNR